MDRKDNGVGISRGEERQVTRIETEMCGVLKGTLKCDREFHCFNFVIIRIRD